MVGFGYYDEDRSWLKLKAWAMTVEVPNFTELREAVMITDGKTFQEKLRKELTMSNGAKKENGSLLVDVCDLSQRLGDEDMAACGELLKSQFFAAAKNPVRKGALSEAGEKLRNRQFHGE